MPQHRITRILRLLLTLSLSVIAAPFARGRIELARAVGPALAMNTEQPFIASTLPEVNGHPSTDPSVDHDFLKQFIVAKSPHQVQIISHLLLSLRQFDAAFQHYFDVVFFHMPNFKLEVTTLSDIRDYSQQNNTLAVFGQYQVIFIAEERMPLSIGFDRELATDLVHEMRHAAMNTMQLTQAGSPYSASTDCYYPPNKPAEKQRVLQFLELGKKRIHALLLSLNDETQGKLTQAQRQPLITLRKQLSFDGEQRLFYHNGLYLRDAFSLKALGEGVKIGAHHQSKAKKTMIVLDIVRDESSQKITAIQYKFADPLYNFASLALSVEESVKNAYDDDKWLYELDAVFQTYLPQIFIRHFYPEFHQYTLNLLNQVLRYPLALRTEQATPSSRHSINKIMALNPELSKATKNYFNVVNQLIRENDIPTVKKSLNIWLKRGIDTSLANLWLARIHHHEQNYRQAKYHYQHAEQQAAPLDSTDRLRYSDVLKKIGLFKKVVKQRLAVTATPVQEPRRKFEL